MNIKLPVLSNTDARILREQSRETLALWYCKLNCFEWVDELPNPEPAVYIKDRSVDRRGAILEWIYKNCPHSFIKTAWHNRHIKAGAL